VGRLTAFTFIFLGAILALTGVADVLGVPDGYVAIMAGAGMVLYGLLGVDVDRRQ